MSPTINHAFITRFNVPTPGPESLIRAADGWLRDRVELFERYCVPAIAAQTHRNFYWLIYFDPESPPWLLDWIHARHTQHGFHPVYRTSVSREDLVSDLRDVTGATAEVLLTTNLDNDDGLATDFVHRLQSAVTGTQRTALYLADGLIISSGKTFLRRDRHNAFCSVAESWDSPVTAWADWHNRLKLTMDVRVLNGSPAWLQVIHGRNVSNTVHGRLVSPSKYVHLFPTLLAGLPEPSTLTELKENVIALPVRAAKTAARRGLKWVLVRTLGKTGLDAVKYRAAALNNRLVRTKR